MKIIIISLLCTLSFCQDFQNGPLLEAHPCPKNKNVVMWYDASLPANQKNRYYVYLKTAIPANSTVRLEFDDEVIITYSFQTDLGRFEQTSMTGEILVFQVYQEFPKFSFIIKGVVPGSISYIESIIINNEEICEDAYSDFFDHFLIDSWDSGPQDNCGRAKVKHSNTAISKLSKPRRGEFPWHSAIYKSDDSFKTYICGGTVVSKTFVLTAAHCVTKVGVPFLPEILSVLFGKIDLRKQYKKQFEKQVHRVIVHQHFRHQYLDNDIALLKLSDELKYGPYIQPACLWYYKAKKIFSTESIFGTVVGWGSKKHTKSHNLRRTDLPMVPFVTCMASDVAFYGSFLVDGSKFCAGYLNGTTIYNGDSGGAFQVFLPDEESSENEITGAFYIRGIVSQTLSKTDPTIALADDSSHYVIFTNIVPYRSWIDAYIGEEDY